MHDPVSYESMINVCAHAHDVEKADKVLIPLCFSIFFPRVSLFFFLYFSVVQRNA